MDITWQSQRGQQRQNNNDAAAIGYVQGYLLAIVVDAAEMGCSGRALSQHWAKEVIYEATHSQAYESPELLIDLMHEKQKSLKHQYLHDVASYCLLRMELSSGYFQLLHVGDCQAGIQKKDSVEWLITPNRVTPYLITRSLNAKRFLRPEIIEATLKPDAGLLLCSDGYWYEHLEQDIPLATLEDDASLLSIVYGQQKFSIQTDVPNVFVSYC